MRTTIATLTLAIAGCTHDVDHFQAYQGPQPIGTIGSGPVGDDDGGAQEDESSDGESDGGGESEGGSAPASGDGGDGGDDGGSAPASDGGSDSGGVGETGTGDPVLDACLEVAATECETCACNLCLDPLYACQQDVGCVAMRDCAQMTGCVGTGCLEPCGSVIEMYGGAFGASGALALALSDCLEGSCPACF